METRTPKKLKKTPLEKKVSSSLLDLLKLMIHLKSLRNDQAAVANENYQKNALEMREKITGLLDEISTDLKKNGKTVVTSFYLNYFLQKLSQYNSLFLSVTDASLHQSDPDVQRLLDLGFRPISHLLLGNRGTTSLTYTKKQDPDAIFRDAKRKQHNGSERFYYDDHYASDDYCHTKKPFIAFYAAANKKIGFATQISNIRSLFTPSEHSQLKTRYWRAKDLDPHKHEKIIFNAALRHIQDGKELTSEESKILKSGEYYRGSGSSVEFAISDVPINKRKAKHHHGGHATQTIDMGIATVVVDPINFECFSKAAYPRNTDPGNNSEDYVSHIVWYSHNHYDHMDEKTAKDAWAGLNPLFIVPEGDAKYLRQWGFKNIIEISSWNEVVEITVSDQNKNTNILNVHALPARHASNRVPSPLMPDINTSLYMGSIMHVLGSPHATLVTGDTGVLDDEHIWQLAHLAEAKDFTISSACIAMGPDRPRQWMECTHQSSADGVAFHAKLNVINAGIIARRRMATERECAVHDINMSDVSITKADFTQAACEGLGYHQGCYRLGVLNYNDVDCTLLRMLSALDVEKNKKLPDLISELQTQLTILNNMRSNIPTDKAQLKLLTNFPFALMDQFERVGLLDTLTAYQTLFNQHQIKMNAAEMMEFIRSHFHLPKPGQTLNLNKSNPGFEFDYQRMIVNRGGETRAYDQILTYIFDNRTKFNSLLQNLAEHKEIDHTALLSGLAEFYVNRNSIGSSKHKIDAVSQFLKKINNISAADATNEMIRLRGKANAWQTADEYQRDEGHLETILLVCYGLLKDKSFQHIFLVDYCNRYPEVNIFTRK